MQLRRYITLFLMFAILSANFTQLFVFAGFAANQKYITSSLCVNRAKPWLHCNGKCYLMKKIAQAEQKDRADERLTQKSLFQEVFFTAAQPITFHSTLLQVIATPYHASAPIVHPGVIFQPPQVV